jgi:hypothetical protein
MSYVFSTEVVSAQRDNFTKRLDRICERILKLPIAELSSSKPDSKLGKELKNISKWIKDAFNLNISVRNPEWAKSGFIMVALPPTANILSRQLKMKDRGQNYQKAINKLKGQWGSVSKVGWCEGVYSKLTSMMGLGIKALVTRGAEPRELSAIILHEVGHVLGYYRSSARTHLMAESLLTAYKMDSEGMHLDKIKVMFESKGHRVKDAKTLKDITLRVIMEDKSQVLDTARFSVVNASSAEALADTLPVQLGYGKEMVRYLRSSMLIRGKDLTASTLKPGFIARVSLGRLGSVMGSILIGGRNLLTPTDVILASGASYRREAFRYDTELTRVKKILAGQVKRMRELESSIPKEEYRRIVDDILELKKEIDEMGEDLLPITNTVAKYFGPRITRESVDIIVATLSEMLQNNVLFAYANKLRG